MLNLCKKRFIFVVLLHRGALSLGENRERLYSEAFHWGLFITTGAFQINSKTEGIYLDVTNGIQPNPANPNQINSDGNWYFREQKMTPKAEIRLLCMILIGSLPRTTSDELIAEDLRKLPLPNKDVKDQHCVWWTLKAVEHLRPSGCIAQFEIGDLEADGTKFADASLQMLREGEVSKVPLMKDYTRA